MRSRSAPPVFAGLIAAAWLAGCAADDARPGLDPVSYFEQYRGGDADAAASGAPGAVPMYETAPAPPGPTDWPGPTDDNVFVDAGDSTFVATSDDAESTFALDVDTGSFHVGRALLEAGARPDPTSIRVEEWVNAFDYGDPPPTDGDDLGAVVETGPAFGATEDTLLVRLGVTTRRLKQRPPAALTFVVDTSGSMDIRERLGLVQSSLALLVEHLDGDDTVAVVTYGDDASPLLPPTPIRDAATIVEAIESLAPGGSTNLEAGLLLGYEQARAAFRPDAVNAVILASDGVANVGVTDPDVLTEQITQAGEQGIHLVTVGYGMGNYNDHLMEQLADQGDGFYRYVDTFEQAEDLFVRDLTPTLALVAEEVKAQVVFEPDMVEAYRLIGYENRGLDDADFRDDTVDAGELGAGHAATALYEVRLRTGGAGAALRSARADAAPLGELRLRWVSAERGEVVERATPIPAAAATSAPSDAFRLAAAVAATAEVLRGNQAVVERGVHLDDVAAAVDALVADDVPGAADLAAVVELALAID
jgi:Ca-activated chloride channel family protein